MKPILRMFALALTAALAACETSGVTTSVSSFSPLRTGFDCGGGESLTVSRSGPSLTASDSRGFSATMPASPPGQSTRYAEGIHALILEGRNATWFVSGQTPLECSR